MLILCLPSSTHKLQSVYSRYQSFFPTVTVTVNTGNLLMLLISRLTNTTEGKLSIMKLHLRVSRVLLCSSRESVLVHLSLPGDSTAVHLRVGSIRAAFPIFCQLLCAAPHVESITLLSFCHLINIYLSRSRRSTVCSHNFALRAEPTL